MKPVRERTLTGIPFSANLKCMGAPAESKEILVYDVSAATDEELASIRENLQILSNIILQESFALLNEGRFFGCYHDHLEIAASAYRADFPCDDCGASLPSAEERH